MQKLFAAIAISSVLFGATTAHACGPGTVKLIEHMMTTNEPPRYRCGSEFNEMLARAQKKDWKGALAAYEKHLANLGKWEAGSANAVRDTRVPAAKISSSMMVVQTAQSPPYSAATSAQAPISASHPRPKCVT